MINSAQHPAAWKRLLSDIDDLTSHLAELSRHMTRDGGIAAAEFEERIAHAYAHLNRIWNARTEVHADRVVEKLEEFIRFPTDIAPIP
jgi:hypothetical protein